MRSGCIPYSMELSTFLFGGSSLDRDGVAQALASAAGGEWIVRSQVGDGALLRCLSFAAPDDCCRGLCQRFFERIDSSSTDMLPLRCHFE